MISQGSECDEKDFINHEMEQVRSTCADLLSSPYELSENWEKNRIYVTREDKQLNNLSTAVCCRLRSKRSRIGPWQRKQQKLKSQDFLLKELYD